MLFTLSFGTSLSWGADFTYSPPGQLYPDSSGFGKRDCAVQAPGIIFPLQGFGFANSQNYNPGGDQPGFPCSSPISLLQCCPSNYSYPWHDNFCEKRSGGQNVSACGEDPGDDHAGQDIRPETCHDELHWVVSASGGRVIHVPAGNPESQYVVVQGSDGLIYSYLHMKSTQVSAQAIVSPGTTLGLVSNVDRLGAPTTTYHLHFEIAILGLDGIERPVSPYMSLVEAYRRKFGYIAVGTPVRASQSINVRSTTSGAVIGQVPAGSLGTVVVSSTTLTHSSYCWKMWDVNWGSIRGLSEDNYLVPVGGQCIPLADGSCEPPAAPTVTTGAATGLSQGSASLNLTVDPNGSATTIWFDYDTDTSFCCTTPQKSVGSGTSPISTSITQGGLTCGKTYFFRARAQNGVGGATPGQILSFTTATCGGGGSGTQNLIRNGTFADDSDFWTHSGDFHATDDFPNFHDGPGYAYLSTASGSPGNNLNGTLYQQVAIPANATAATLSFWTSISTSEPTGGAAQDFLNATLQKSSGSFLSSLRLYSNQDASSGYVRREFNLINFVGQTIRLHFLGTTNNDSQPTIFRVDDVRLDISLPSSTAPQVTTLVADQINQSSARLNMTANPGGANTEVWFDLEADDSTPNDETEHIAIGGGTQDRTVSISVYNLECGTRYYFRAHASNSVGQAPAGSLRDFRTTACSGGGGSSAPSVTTQEAGAITGNSAVLNALVNPRGSETRYYFKWGTTTSYDHTTVDFSAGSGSSVISIALTLEGLVCGTTYHFRAFAINAFGTTDGVDRTFTTLACGGVGPPFVTTDEAGVFSGSLVVLNATINPNGVSTRYYFKWGTTSSYGQTTLDLNAGSGSANVSTSVTLEGLACGTTYHFRAVAFNSFETTEGGDRSFATLACGPGALPVVSVTATDVTATENPMTSGTFLIQRTGSTASALSVTYTILGTAIMGVDHSLGQGTVTIPAGVSAFTIPVFPADDFYVEDDETVVLSLQPSLAYTVGSPGSAVVTIISEDGMRPMIFEDDMESGPRWNYQSTWALTQSSAHSPTHSWTDSPLGNYANNTEAFIAIGGLDLRNRHAVQLSFWHRYQFADSGDVGRVWVRADDGSFSQQVVRTFSGTSTGWTKVTIDLSALAGKTLVVIAFELVTNAAGTGDGWYIDDVAIYEPKALDFYSVTPCRFADTRQGPAPLFSGVTKIFSAGGMCGIPVAAKAVSINASAVAGSSGGFITLFPADEAVPTTTTINFRSSQTRTNNAVLGLSSNGELASLATLSGGSVHLILDANGYFSEAAHPLVGTWEGTIATYPSVLYIEENNGEVSARILIAGANPPTQDLIVIYATETEFRAIRPLDNDAELRLSLVQSGLQMCLDGEYLERGTSRPISLCRTP
ncbi:MAG: peptidoglycan DD-metalloendopeptidase family protein [Acidobacteriota bacterium]